MVIENTFCSTLKQCVVFKFDIPTAWTIEVIYLYLVH